MIEYINQDKEQLLKTLNINKSEYTNVIIYPTYYKPLKLHVDIQHLYLIIEEMKEKYNLNLFYGKLNEKHIDLLSFFLEDYYLYTINFDNFVAIIKNLPKHNQGKIYIYNFHIFSNIFNEMCNFEYFEQYLIDCKELQNERFTIHI